MKTAASVSLHSICRIDRTDDADIAMIDAGQIKKLLGMIALAESGCFGCDASRERQEDAHVVFIKKNKR
jgi:hypothetical protein